MAEQHPVSDVHPVSDARVNRFWRLCHRPNPQSPPRATDCEATSTTGSRGSRDQAPRAKCDGVLLEILFGIESLSHHAEFRESIHSLELHQEPVEGKLVLLHARHTCRVRRHSGGKVLGSPEAMWCRRMRNATVGATTLSPPLTSRPRGEGRAMAASGAPGFVRNLSAAFASSAESPPLLSASKCR